MLGLIKTDEKLELVCQSDPAIGGEGDTWELKNGHKGCTVITIRVLNDRELLRLSSSFAGMEAEGESNFTADQTLEFAAAMERIVRAAFVSCAEGEVTTKDADLVVQSLRIGPLIGLGSFILNESGATADPT